MNDQHKPLTAAEIEELRELEAKATPGPWCGMFGMPTNVLGACGIRVARCDFDGDFSHPDTHANAALIAAMRNTLPRLLSMLTPPTDEELREAVKRMECVLLSRLLDGVANVEVMYADLSVLLRAAQAPRLTKEQVEARVKAERELAEANSSEAPKSSLRTHAPDCAVNHPMSGKPWCMACTCGAEKPKPPFTEAVRLIREEFGHNWKDAKPGTCLMGADYSNPVPEAEWKCPREGCGWETALAGSGCCPGGGDPRKAGPCDKRQPEPEDCPECDGAGQQINVLAGPTSGLMRNCPACHGTGIKGFVPAPAPLQAATGARGEADAMLSAMIGECSMCGNGPGCGKDCDGYDHWIPKHDASPESLELLKALRLADKGKLASALRAAQAPRLTPEQVEAVKTAHANLLAHACPNDEDVAERLEREFPGVFGKEG